MMSTKEFVDAMMELVKNGCPELYKVHIEGRESKFVSENAPSEGDLQGEILGHLEWDLQLLWALVSMFGKNLPDEWPGEDPLLDTIKHPEQISAPLVAALMRDCQIGFWHILSALYKGTMGPGDAIKINSDWSVVGIKKENLSAKKRITQLERVVSAAWIHVGISMALRASSALLKEKGLSIYLP